MSIALVVTRGYGNGTLTGSIKDVTLRGYDIGEELAVVSGGKRYTVQHTKNRFKALFTRNRYTVR